MAPCAGNSGSSDGSGVEPEALAELYDELAGQVYRTALIMTGSIPLADDITQAEFLGAWHSPDTMLGHHDHLGEHLTRVAYARGALWRANHPTERPTLPIPPLPQGGGAGGVTHHEMPVRLGGSHPHGRWGKGSPQPMVITTSAAPTASVVSFLREFPGQVDADLVRDLPDRRRPSHRIV